MDIFADRIIGIYFLPCVNKRIPPTKFYKIKTCATISSTRSLLEGCSLCHQSYIPTKHCNSAESSETCEAESFKSSTVNAFNLRGFAYKWAKCFYFMLSVLGSLTNHPAEYQANKTFCLCFSNWVRAQKIKSSKRSSISHNTTLLFLLNKPFCAAVCWGSSRDF